MDRHRPPPRDRGFSDPPRTYIVRSDSDECVPRVVGFVRRGGFTLREVIEEVGESAVIAARRSESIERKGKKIIPANEDLPEASLGVVIRIKDQ